MRSLFSTAVMLLILLGGLPRANAGIIVGGIPFANNAFADTLLDENAPLVPFNAPSVSAALIDSDPADGVDLLSGSVLLGFVDNTPVNGPGSDIALFESGGVEGFFASLTVAGLSVPAQRVQVTVAATGFFDTFAESINVGFVDLTDLGVGNGNTVDQIAVATDSGTVLIGGADLTAVGALNQIPEPNTFLLLASSSVCLVAYRWQRKRKAAA